MKKLIQQCFFLLFFTQVLYAQQIIPIPNGDFETPITGTVCNPSIPFWTLAPTNPVASVGLPCTNNAAVSDIPQYANGIAPNAANSWIDLTSCNYGNGGSIQQVVSGLVPNGTYAVSFDLIGVCGQAGLLNQQTTGVDIFVNGSQVGGNYNFALNCAFIDCKDPNNSFTTTQRMTTLSFQADNLGNADIRIVGNGACFPGMDQNPGVIGIDNVALECVTPLPNALLDASFQNGVLGAWTVWPTANLAVPVHNSLNSATNWVDMTDLVAGTNYATGQSIQQTVNLAPGFYSLSFRLGAVTLFGQATSAVTVSVNGVQVPSATNSLYSVDCNLATPSTLFWVNQLSSVFQVTGGPTTITITESGTAGTGINDAVGVTAVDNFELNSIGCITCAAAADPINYNHIDATTFSFPPGYNTWAGKYYIHGGVLSVPSGVTLDLTNVDLVFDNISGLDVQTGTTIIGYNSVFRPCNENDSWVGVNISPQAEGTLRACTFINAEQAIHFIDNGTSINSCVNNSNSQVEITNNLFTNCLNAIQFDRVENYCQPITGNTFVVDNANISFPNAGNVRMAINANNCNFTENIAQNDFIYSGDVDNATTQFLGINMAGGTAFISNNQFSNLFKSIALSKVTSCQIENNEIENTQYNMSYDFPIFSIGHARNLVISNNKIHRILSRNVLNDAAILVSSTQGSFTIIKNTIKGYNNGIMGDLLNGLSANRQTIVENEIESASVFGIVLNKSSNVSVRCNKINMDMNAGSTGIACFQTADVDNNINIFGNCVLDTDVAINVECNGCNANIPVIKNNFLYNYVRAGVNNIDFTGSIGWGCSTSDEAGSNTFISNNSVTLTPDIISSMPISSIGNWGLSNVSGVSTIACSDDYSSYASCAHQTNGSTHNTAHHEECLRQWDNVNNVFKVSEGGSSYHFAVNEDVLSKMIDNEDYSWELMIDIIKLYRSQNEKEKADALYARILNQNSLSTNEKAWLNYFNAFMQNQYTIAFSTLNNIQAQNLDESDKVVLEKIKCSFSLGTKNDLEDADNGMIQAIIDRKGTYENDARLLRQIYQHQGDLTYPTMPAVTLAKFDKVVTVKEESLTAFPNPAQNEVTINCFLKGSEGTLKIFDALGRIVSSEKISNEYSTRALDTSSFIEGAYFLQLEDNSGVSEYLKLIIIH